MPQQRKKILHATTETWYSQIKQKKKVDRKQEKEMEKELSAQEKDSQDTVAHGAM